MTTVIAAAVPGKRAGRSAGVLGIASRYSNQEGLAPMAAAEHDSGPPRPLLAVAHAGPVAAGPAYVDWLEAENQALVEAARLGVDALVPSCPGWSVRDLVFHHASFQSWITGLIVDRVQEPQAPLVAAKPPKGKGILRWYEQIAAGLVVALRATDPATPVWGVTAEHTAGAWARRQASESSVHRWDAQNAHDVCRPIEHADDYLSELFGLLLPNLIANFGLAVPNGSMALSSVDDGRVWLVRPSDLDDADDVHAGDLADDDGDIAADVVVSGTSSDLLLAMWNRTSDVEIEGDLDVLRGWRAATSGS